MRIMESVSETIGYVNDGAIVVETRENRLSRIIDENIECSVFVVNSNDENELRIVIEALSMYFEDIKKNDLNGCRVIFHMIINEGNIQMFKDFEEIYDIEVILSKNNHQTH